MRRVAWITFILWTLGMTYLLLVPGSDIPKIRWFENQDKVAHLILFSGWCFLFVFVMKARARTVVFTVFVFGAIMAGITEWLQAYIPYRTPDLADLILDFVGITLGVILGHFVKKELFST